jgi:hypothetical protein
MSSVKGWVITLGLENETSRVQKKEEFLYALVVATFDIVLCCRVSSFVGLTGPLPVFEEQGLFCPAIFMWQLKRLLSLCKCFACTNYAHH